MDEPPRVAPSPIVPETCPYYYYYYYVVQRLSRYTFHYINATADRQSRDCAVIPISRDLSNPRIKEQDSSHQDLPLLGGPVELLKGIDGPELIYLQESSSSLGIRVVS